VVVGSSNKKIISLVGGKIFISLVNPTKLDALGSIFFIPWEKMPLLFPIEPTNALLQKKKKKKPTNA
jgi:hypothetical protein